MDVTAKIGTFVARMLGRFAFVGGGGQRFPNWTLRFEITVDVIRLLSKQFGGQISKPELVVGLRRRIEIANTIGDRIACGWTDGVPVESINFLGLEHIWIKSMCSEGESTCDCAESYQRHQQHRRHRVIPFFHGGGFVMASPRAYISFGLRLLAAVAGALAQDERCDPQSIRVDMLLANYRKAPEHPFPAAPNDAYAVHKYLLDHEGLDPAQIIVAGDSAGASLALTTLTTIRDITPQDLPIAGVLLCPFVDMDPSHVLENHEAPHCLLAREGVLGSLRAYASGGISPTCLDDSINLRDSRSCSSKSNA